MKKLLSLSAVALVMLASCSSKNESKESAAPSAASAEVKEERNKQAALANLEGMNKHDFNKMFKDVAANIVDYGNSSMPPVKNVDSLKAMLQMFTTAFPDYKADVISAAADGDKVFVYADCSGTFKNDMEGMKATNKSFKIKDVDIFTFDDAGKMTEHRSVIPFDQIMKQVGAGK